MCAGRPDELGGSHGGGESVVKSGNSCEDMFAVGGRLKQKREAELEVRFSWEGKAEGVGLEGRGVVMLVVGMVTGRVRKLRAGRR